MLNTHINGNKEKFLYSEYIIPNIYFLKVNISIRYLIGLKM